MVEGRDQGRATIDMSASAAKRDGSVPQRRKRLRELLPLRNPIILGSGPSGRNADSLIKHGELAGALVGKSVTWLPQKGNPPPRIVRVGDFGLINWEDLPNPGYKEFCRHIKKAKASCPCPIIGSIGPLESIDQQVTIAKALQEAGSDAIELDFKWGAGVKGNLLYRITHEVKKAVSIPVFAKLSPFVEDTKENAKVVEQAGCDAITAINAVYPAMKIDVRRQAPALLFGSGGLSGRPILSLAVAAVYQIYETVNVPIMGCGGVVTGEDALELILAGADAVQICTTPMAEGPGAFRRIADELNALLQDLGFNSVEECIGLAHRVSLYQPQSPTAKL